MAITAGTRFGSYEILCPIGAGGMGVVYRARDVRLGRSVAIKTVSPKCISDKSRLQYFELEAKALSSINHPNIITLYALGDPADVYYIVMELVEGQSLRQHLMSRRMKLRAALDVGTQVASALGAAHSVGIVHRDIKPENVMVRPDGLVKVLDFGLAKLTQPLAFGQTHAASPELLNQDTLPLDEVNRESLASHENIPNARPAADTVQRRILGTAGYMSPEFLCGQEVDTRTDIFSLGVTLYELITGVRPFGGQSHVEVINTILEQEPPPLSCYRPGISRDLEHIISKALRKDRDSRYQDIKDLLIDLQDVKQEREFEATLKQYEAIDRFKANMAYGQFEGEPSHSRPAQTRQTITWQMVWCPQMCLSKFMDNALGAAADEYE